MFIVESELRDSRAPVCAPLSLIFAFDLGSVMVKATVVAPVLQHPGTVATVEHGESYDLARVRQTVRTLQLVVAWVDSAELGTLAALERDTATHTGIHGVSHSPVRTDVSQSSRSMLHSGVGVGDGHEHRRGERRQYNCLDECTARGGRNHLCGGEKAASEGGQHWWVT